MTAEEKALIIDAAERHARELLNQAGKYEKLKMPSVVKETMALYKPLRSAIDTFTKELV